MHAPLLSHTLLPAVHRRPWVALPTLTAHATHAQQVVLVLGAAALAVYVATQVLGWDAFPSPRSQQPPDANQWQNAPWMGPEWQQQQQRQYNPQQQQQQYNQQQQQQQQYTQWQQQQQQYAGQQQQQRRQQGYANPPPTGRSNRQDDVIDVWYGGSS